MGRLDRKKAHSLVCLQVCVVAETRSHSSVILCPDTSSTSCIKNIICFLFCVHGILVS